MKSALIVVTFAELAEALKLGSLKIADVRPSDFADSIEFRVSGDEMLDEFKTSPRDLLRRVRLAEALTDITEVRCN